MLTRTVTAQVEVKYVRDVIDDCGLWSPLKPGSAPHDALQELFRDVGSYRGASEVFRKSYALERMADRYRTNRGRNVMTLLKCKGKEFDAVVIFDGLHGQHRLAPQVEDESSDESRRLLHVGITRARYAVFILTPENSPCRLLPGRRTEAWIKIKRGESPFSRKLGNENQSHHEPEGPAGGRDG